MRGCVAQRLAAREQPLATTAQLCKRVVPACAQRPSDDCDFCASVLACGSPPLQITTIQVGRTLTADPSVAEFATVFAPHDIIHLSVLTAGGGSGPISVRSIDK